MLIDITYVSYLRTDQQDGVVLDIAGLLSRSGISSGGLGSSGSAGGGATKLKSFDYLTDETLHSQSRTDGGEPPTGALLLRSRAVDICWAKQNNGDNSTNINTNTNNNAKRRSVYFCKQPLRPLKEKTLRSYGPIRGVFGREVVVVYGTPSRYDCICMCLCVLVVYVVMCV
jgi:hypothetical protein